MTQIRIGHGYDVHAFTEGEYIMLGGVRIPYTMGLAAHSDGDVLIHAICDALLGAAALGDIGHHFPDTDDDFAGIDSRKLLRKVGALLADKQWTISNVDATVIAQAPKLATYILDMRQNIAADLGLEIGQVSVKATTTEGLGFAGRNEGIETHAIALVTSA